LSKHSQRRRLTLLVALVIGAAAAALAASAGGSSAARNGMAPGARNAALYHKIGSPLANANGTVAFGCQLTNYQADGIICYGPDQMRAAYGVQPLLDRHLDGSGQTIVIIDAYGSDTLAADVANFDGVWGLPAPDLQVVAPFGIAPTDPDNAAGWSGETSLDVEWAHAIAPGAKILLVVARSNEDSDILAATQWVYDHNAGDVVSQSYGEAEQCMDPALLDQQHRLFRQMTRRGITLLASSGDAGAGQYTCDGSGYFKAVSTPASDPYVTGVGGTMLFADGVSGEYQGETTWNESETFGDAVAGGGGLSVVYSRPDYQAAVLDGRDLSGRNDRGGDHGHHGQQMRGVPDISYNAGVFTGVIVAWDGSFWLFGGTSAGSPQWAGLVAIADQLGRGRVGDINPALYQVGTLGHVSSLFFHDIADGSSNSIPDVGVPGAPIDGYSATRGYDLATGLGTPIASRLVPWLAVHADRSGDDHGSQQGGNGWNGRRGHKHDH
jgi:subtilase family serine protease